MTPCTPAQSNGLLCRGRIMTEASRLKNGHTKVDITGVPLAFEHVSTGNIYLTAVYPNHAVLVSVGMPGSASIDPYRDSVRGLLVTATQRLG